MWTAEEGKPVGKGNVRPEGLERVGGNRAGMGKAGVFVAEPHGRREEEGAREQRHVLAVQEGRWWGTQQRKPGVGV